MNKMEKEELTQVAQGMSAEQQEIFIREFSNDLLFAELRRRMEYMESLVQGIFGVIQEQEKSTADG